MAQRKVNEKAVKRRIWRVTPEAPNGEYVDAETLAAERARTAAAERAGTEPQDSEPGWLTSSHELHRGVVVTDETDSIPGELFEKLFSKK